MCVVVAVVAVGIATIDIIIGKHVNCLSSSLAAVCLLLSLLLLLYLLLLILVFVFGFNFGFCFCCCCHSHSSFINPHSSRVSRCVTYTPR